MPWRETQVVEERMKFVAARLAQEFPMSELCVAFGISRKTGYKWLARYERWGPAGLVDASRAPQEQARRTPAALAERIVRARRAHPSWGPRKLRAILAREDPGLAVPAASTIGDILTRQGLISPRRRRRAAPRATPTELGVAQAPNDIWAADFKGWFRTRNGQRCDPLTLSDLFSRFQLRCVIVAAGRTEPVWEVFTSAFKEYGLPVALRSDNGPPFASPGLAGLSRLGVRCLRLGIRLERIRPGAPQENGCHERMHRTLGEAIRPPRATPTAQQRAFNAFRESFNHQRPHEALGQRVPADVYQRSPRPYPRRLPTVEYPAHFEVRQVRTAGTIKWAGELLYVSQALCGEPVGLERLTDRHWRLQFATYPLALLDAPTRTLLPYHAVEALDAAEEEA